MWGSFSLSPLFVLDSVICVLEACGVVVLYFRRLIYYLLIERVYP